jgi:hypothetical protein
MIIEDLTDLLIFKAKLEIGMKFEIVEGYYLPLISGQIYEVVNILKCDQEKCNHSLCNRKTIVVKGKTTSVHNVCFYLLRFSKFSLEIRSTKKVIVMKVEDYLI